MKETKVLMLIGKGELATLMFNGIQDSFLIGHVIIETPVSKKYLLQRRSKKLGLAKVIGQIVFMLYNSIWLKNNSQARIAEIKRKENLNDTKIDETIISRVESVNSEETIRLLQQYQPDVVIVNGTRIIKKAILNAIDAPFINTHVGITPKYRGVHGGYWALTENDVENCGVTIHLIDTGIDTGGVLYQDIINITNMDNFNTYPYLQISVAIPLMNKAIRDIINKTYKVQNTNLPSNLWSHPTAWEYLKHRVLYGVK